MKKVLLTKLKTALDKKQKRSISIDVGNTDRSFGTIFGSEITKKYYNTLEDDTLLYSVQEPADRALEHLFQMVLH